MTTSAWNGMAIPTLVAVTSVAETEMSVDEMPGEAPEETEMSAVVTRGNPRLRERLQTICRRARAFCI